MRYLFIDIRLACGKIDHKLGLCTGSRYDYLCNVRAKLVDYGKQLNESQPNDQREINRIAVNFDRFVKRHNIEY